MACRRGPKNIFQAYELKDCGIFILPHMLIISARPDEEPVMRQREISNIVVNMEELSRLN